MPTITSDAQHAAIRLSISRKGTGLCGSCGSSNVINPNVQWAYCRACLQKNSTQFKEYLQQWRKDNQDKTKEYRQKSAPKRKQLREEKLDKKLCVYSSCTESHVDGKTLCPKHLEYFRIKVMECAKRKKDKVI